MYILALINFLNESWKPIHVIVGLFEMDETIGKSMVVWFKSLLSKFGLMHRVIAFVKDEGNNLSIMATKLCFIIICQPLKFNHVYEGTYFGHVMFKACQYATNDDKVFKGLIQVNVKDAQATLQMIITWKIYIW